MPRFAAVALALGLSTPLAAAAQDPLTLDRAVEAVVARNASLAGARADAGTAEAGADEAHAGAFPRIFASEAWQRSNDPVFVFGSVLSARRFTAANFALDALNHPPSTAAFRTTVGADQIVFDGGRQRAGAHAARREAEAARLSIDIRTADLVVAATGTFGRMLAAQAAERAAEAGLIAAREDRARAERRRDAGMTTDADVLAISVHVSDLERRRIEARGDAAVALAELNHLMGDPIERAWVAVDTSPASGNEAPLPDLGALIAQAEATRAEVRRADALRQAAADTARGAARLLVPQVAVQAAIDFAGTDFGHRASAWMAGGALQWSFSAGGAESARRRAASQRAARAQADAEDARAAVHVEVVTAYRRLETARLRRIAARAAIAEARERQRIVRDRFDAGMAGVADVLRASSDLLDAESHDTAARVDALVASSALARATGRP
jgi:outer membrane protein TolC